MPTQFPPGSPQLVGDVLEINRFLKDTPWVLRALRDIANEQFVADKLLTQQFWTESGALGYEQQESIYADRAPQPVTPGGEYPLTSIGTGPASTANTVNWGNDALITDSSIRRQKFPVVTRSFRKLMNTHISHIDSIGLSAVVSSITATTPAIESWATNDGTEQILRDVMRAITAIIKLKQGYAPNAVFVEPDVYANIISNDKLMKLLPREYPGQASTPIAKGLNGALMKEAGGITWITSPNAPVMNGAVVIDTTMFGGFTDEIADDPGYVQGENGLQVKTIREDGTDGWRIRARRMCVPVVLEPGAALIISGVN